MLTLLFIALIINIADFEAMCIFKALRRGKESKAGEVPVISREEFNSFYEVQGMKWKQVGHFILFSS